MKLIYVAYANVSVFDSQVIALLNHYIQTGKVNEIILILGVNYKDKFESKKTKNLNEKIKLKFYKQFPQYFLIEKLTIASLSRTFKDIDHIDEYVIHVRNDVLAHYVYKALLKLNIRTDRIIADVRGAGLEQLMEFSNKNKFILKLKKIQRKQVYRSLADIKNISVVSKSLKKYIFEKVGDNIDVKINSCLANYNFKYNETERFAVREKLNVKKNENLLVLSTGGDNTWQNTKDTIIELTGKKFKILNLSRIEIKHNNVINRFVPYEEMFKYLCAADAAIIWRKKSVTNEVASPVKFSEYVSSGLPVLTNDSVQLIANYIILNKSGEIFQSLESIDKSMLNRVKNLDRNTISITGLKVFGINTIANQYVEQYNSVLNL